MEFKSQNIPKTTEDQNIKRELIQEEKETLKSLEDIPFIDSVDKYRILLVWRKLKNGTEFELKKEITDDEIQNIKEIIEKSGLFAKIVEGFKPVDSKFQRKLFFIANNQEDLELLSKLFLGNHYTPEVYNELGRIYGFPKTAIEAFDQTHHSSPDHDNDQFLLEFDEISKKISPEIMSFLSFRLSKEHWETEVETIKKWAEEIKLLDPVLYQTILDRKNFKTGGY